MSKLAKEDKFLDLSDYGRAVAKAIVKAFLGTRLTAISYTFLFGLCGLGAAFLMYHAYFKTAAFLLICKSILDAADGEWARQAKHPSYTGRYLDSVFDFLLNFLFVIMIAHISQQPYSWAFVAFFCIQLQGTLYNFYYVILRTRSVGGDSTSKIFEKKAPVAFAYESQRVVNFLYKTYVLFYGTFDRLVYALDGTAHRASRLPNWFMTTLSIYGLGFHLLVMAICLSLEIPQVILPYFIFSSLLFPVFLVLRKKILL